MLRDTWRRDDGAALRQRPVDQSEPIPPWRSARSRRCRPSARLPK